MVCMSILIVKWIWPNIKYKKKRSWTWCEIMTIQLLFILIIFSLSPSRLFTAAAAAADVKLGVFFLRMPDVNIVNVLVVVCAPLSEWEKKWKSVGRKIRKTIRRVEINKRWRHITTTTMMMMMYVLLSFFRSSILNIKKCYKRVKQQSRAAEAVQQFSFVAVLRRYFVVIIFALILLLRFFSSLSPRFSFFIIALVYVCMYVGLVCLYIHREWVRERDLVVVRNNLWNGFYIYTAKGIITKITITFWRVRERERNKERNAYFTVRWTIQEWNRR